MKDFPYTIFLETGIPNLMLLGAIANYEGRPPETVMTEVLQKVRRKTKSEMEFDILAEQLHVLSNQPS